LSLSLLSFGGFSFNIFFLQIVPRFFIRWTICSVFISTASL
jgi:hypothetical protein